MWWSRPTATTTIRTTTRITAATEPAPWQTAAPCTLADAPHGEATGGGTAVEASKVRLGRNPGAALGLARLPGHAPSP
uniref:Uncharacterized protein n=1 Tax=Ralstonia solanacearum TaxID=305 RepID=A0A0S4WL98_RALSL|nr:protein of unknown function [Ralstonia solanacearum]